MLLPTSIERQEERLSKTDIQQNVAYATSLKLRVMSFAEFFQFFHLMYYHPISLHFNYALVFKLFERAGNGFAGGSQAGGQLTFFYPEINIGNTAETG
jgi:hypothetical protein